MHHGLTNCWRLGATIPGHTSPIRPIVIAVFSSRVFGVFGLDMARVIIKVTMKKMAMAIYLLMMVMRGLRMAGM